MPPRPPTNPGTSPPSFTLAELVRGGVGAVLVGDLYDDRAGPGDGDGETMSDAINRESAAWDADRTRGSRSLWLASVKARVTCSEPGGGGVAARGVVWAAWRRFIARLTSVRWVENIAGSCAGGTVMSPSRPSARFAMKSSNGLRSAFVYSDKNAVEKRGKSGSENDGKSRHSESQKTEPKTLQNARTTVPDHERVDHPIETPCEFTRASLPAFAENTPGIGGGSVPLHGDGWADIERFVRDQRRLALPSSKLVEFGRWRATRDEEGRPPPPGVITARSPARRAARRDGHRAER